MKAILLHHAGGDKYAFRNVQQWLLPEIKSIAFELPGRSDRFSEGFIKNMEDAVNDIYEQLIKELPEKYCIIGNSMGAVIGFLLTHKLNQEHKILPEYLFFVSRLSPDAYRNESNFVLLSSDDFWKVVQKYDGVPEQLLAHQELKEFYEPILRADFELLHHFNQTFSKVEPLDIPICILCGNKDVRNITQEKAEGWQKFFSAAFEIKSFEGGHFFLYENEDAVKYIKSKLQIGK